MQQLPPPRIAAVHDLSCVGRCALTVIIPTLSAMGYQTVPLPTALLSSHTGGFEGLHFRDLTGDMHSISDHFLQLGMSFRSIYTGFLGSELQIRTVTEFIERFADIPDESTEKPLILVDPVMGDDGVLYSTYTEELVQGIRDLSRHAHVLTPNLTEACLLTHTPYRDTASLSHTEALEYADAILEKLQRLYPCRTVITGIPLRDGTVANLGTTPGEAPFLIQREQLGASYPGTGDIFASVLLGALLGGKSFLEACEKAADFIGTLIRYSVNIPTQTRFGVALEPCLGELMG